MYLTHRSVVFALGALILMTIPGCFLFGGKKETTESAIAASEQLRKGQIATEEAMFRADMAIEEERYDAAVIEYNRAIRADSSNVDAYLELASLHQQLSAQYRAEGNIEAALQENTRALSVLSNLVKYQAKSAKQGVSSVPPAPSNKPANAVLPPDTGTAPESEPPPAETPAPEEMEPENPDGTTP